MNFLKYLLLTGLMISFAFPSKAENGKEVESKESKKPIDSGGEPSNGFRLSAALIKKNYTVNQAIFAKLILKNIDNEEHWVWAGSERNYYLLVNTNSNLIRAKLEGIMVGPFRDLSDGTSTWTRTLVPAGSEIQEKLDLNYQLESLKPGKYIVTICRDIPILPAPTNANAKVQYTKVFAKPVEFTVIAPSNFPATNK
jgi:hypothetical protein